MIKVATIAGSDASGGAGLETDLKTFSEFGLYGMTAITVIATMQSKNWQHSVFPIDGSIFDAQLDTIFSGIGVSAVKSGMLGSEETVEKIAKVLLEHNVKNYVLDPVMICKGSNEALNPELNEKIEKFLLPICNIVTPNLFEAEQLSHKKISTKSDVEKVAKILYEKGAKNVFIKGGSKLFELTKENSNIAEDLFFDGDEFFWISEKMLNTKWTHGAGCTTSAAITAALAFEKTPLEAVQIAKKFVHSSLSNGFALNRFVGPGNPCAWRKGFLDS